MVIDRAVPLRPMSRSTTRSSPEGRRAALAHLNVSSGLSRITSSMHSVTGSVAAGATLPWSRNRRSPRRRRSPRARPRRTVALRCSMLAGLEDHLQVRGAAGRPSAATTSLGGPGQSGRRGTRRGRSPCRSRRRRPTAARVLSFTASGALPDGKAVATDATFTRGPRERAAATRTRSVDADRGHGGNEDRAGRGATPWLSARDRPGVSAPSSVVRSISGSRARARRLRSRLIERFASSAARASRATASTAPCAGADGGAAAPAPAAERASGFIGYL